MYWVLAVCWVDIVGGRESWPCILGRDSFFRREKRMVFGMVLQYILQSCWWRYNLET